MHVVCGPGPAPAAATIAARAEWVRSHWPSSTALRLPGSAPLAAGRLFANPTLAATWKRLPAQAEAGGAPGKRPRTTLSPTLVLEDGEPCLACGTPGGDQQDQWQLVFLLRHLRHGQDLQAAIDAPLFHGEHGPLSFFPRRARPRSVQIEDRFPYATLEELARRGHRLSIRDGWSIGRLTAAARTGDLLKAAATPRLMQAYAVGR